MHKAVRIIDDPEKSKNFLMYLVCKNSYASSTSYKHKEALFSRF